MANDDADQQDTTMQSAAQVAPASAPVTKSAPTTPPQTNRSSLIAAAIKFLSDPKVQSAPLAKKIAFLESKGLTSTEIEGAMISVAGGSANPPPIITTPPPPQQQIVRSGASTAAIVLSTAAVASSLTLLTSHVLNVYFPSYQEYLPEFMRSDYQKVMLASEEEARVELEERITKAINEAFDKLSLPEPKPAEVTTVDTEQVRMVVSEVVDSKLSSVTSELKSLKGLLLGVGSGRASRFPFAPANSARSSGVASSVGDEGEKPSNGVSVLPKWQLEMPIKKESENEESDDTFHDVTSEENQAPNQQQQQTKKNPESPNKAKALVNEYFKGLEETSPPPNLVNEE